MNEEKRRILKRILDSLSLIEAYQKDIYRLVHETFFETKTDWESTLNSVSKKLSMMTTIIMRLSKMIENKKEVEIK